MKTRKYSLMLLSLICIALIAAGCSGGNGSSAAQGSSTQTPASGSTGENPAADKQKLLIGAALPDFSDKWLSYLQEGMKKYEESQSDIEVTYVDSQNDASKQLAQVETFISQKVDAIVIVPVDTVSAVDIVAKANDANIPIVVVNRYFDGVDKATAYAGSESITAGVMQMEEVARLLGGKGNIAIMRGQSGQEAEIMRTEGNKQVIEKNQDMEIVLEGTASWDRAKGMALMENWLNSGKEIDALVSNNDEMAIGAIMAAEAAGKAGDIIFAGVDATPDALEFVKSGKLQVTVFQNADGQGKAGLETAAKAARGEPVEKNVYVPYELVTQENVEEYIKKWQ